MKLFISILIAFFCITNANAAADYIKDGKGTSSNNLCPDAEIFGQRLITGICWSCMLPFKLFGMGSPDGEPDGASNASLCFCEGPLGIPSFGFHVGFWNPLKLVEVVRQPFCSPVLGGTAFGFNPTQFGGYAVSHEGDYTTSQQGFYHVNYWAFPLMSIMELILQYNCQADAYSEMDLISTSTIDPILNDPELGLLMIPEVVLFANPLAQAACAVDCTLTTTTGKSSNSFFWCAGCWGSMYPFTTHNVAAESPPRESSLVAAKYIAVQHRRGFARKTFGDNAMCGGEIYPFFPKQQYRWSMIHPIPEAHDDETTIAFENPSGLTTPSTGDEKNSSDDSVTMSSTLNDRCCHATGESTFVWGEWRNIPVIGEDFVYMLWSYTDCCAN
ncbi:MAG: TraU family protein [Methylophilus sp.]|uniref:TraU family protein n=1 Tax=Methylophilus sp. TaxID=29541 RepID=UPI003F9FF056